MPANSASRAGDPAPDLFGGAEDRHRVVDGDDDADRCRVVVQVGFHLGRPAIPDAAGSRHLDAGYLGCCPAGDLGHDPVGDVERAPVAGRPEHAARHRDREVGH